MRKIGSVGGAVLRQCYLDRDKGSPAAKSDLNSPPRGGGGPEAGNADPRPTHEKVSYVTFRSLPRKLLKGVRVGYSHLERENETPFTRENETT